MIVKENVVINGLDFVHTWSNIGMMIERDEIYYDDAYDPATFGREYTETDIPSESAAATEEDYLAALERLGVTDE